MSVIDMRICNAWREAAIDLEIRVVAPAVVMVDTLTLEFEAHILDFGSAGGAIAMSPASRREFPGLWTSVLFDSYAAYDRVLFIDTLNDWQWYGAGDPPDWYTGQCWSSLS